MEVIDRKVGFIDRYRIYDYTYYIIIYKSLEIINYVWFMIYKYFIILYSLYNLIDLIFNEYQVIPSRRPTWMRHTGGYAMRFPYSQC